MLYCSKCGKEIREKDNYCAGCGNKIKQFQETEMESSKQTVSFSPTITKPKNMILNMAMRDVDARKQHVGDKEYVSLPKEQGRLEQAGLLLGRFLMNRIGLNTPKDLLLKIAPFSIISLAAAVLFYQINLNIWFTAIALMVTAILFSVIVTAFNSQCKKCGKFFGMETIDNKYLRGKKFATTTVHNIEQTRQCKYCGDIEIEKIIEKEDNE